MSKVIDERVVEMRFDNKDFESNVQTSLKTIDKLKDSLNFDESTRSVEKFTDSLRHFSLDDIGHSVESLSDKFNWANVFKVELLHNVVESIYSTITGVFNRIKGELHLEDVDPVSNMILGWGKYAEKTQSVATIMAATGESIEYVNKQMEDLLYFTDETSYSFTDMAGNIGKFTANGVPLEEAAASMEGIATWAARSGQNAATASRVMYNLSQAIGMGALKLQDWKSVELANMGTKEFKEMAIQAGLATGALIENAEGIAVINDETAGTAKETMVTFENFRETLKDGWFNTETINAVLGEYGKAAMLINEIHNETGLYASEMLDLVEAQKKGVDITEELSAALEEAGIEPTAEKVDELRAQIELLASKEYEFSVETYKAAQEARTFGDAMAAVADSVSSGWMKTFELIFGGYDKAKIIWTDLAENLIEIFGAANDARNNLLKEANMSGFDIFKNSLAEAGVSMLDLESSVKRVVGTKQLRLMIGDATSFEEAIKDGTISVKTLEQAIDKLPKSFKVIKEISGEVTDNYEEMTAWSWELRQGLYGWDEGHDYQVQKLMEAKKISQEYAEQVVELSERHEELGRQLTKEEAAQWLTYTGLSEQVEENIELTDAEREAWKALLNEIDQAAFEESLRNGLLNIGAIALTTFKQVRAAITGMFPPATASQLRVMGANFEKITSSILKFISGAKDDTGAIKNIVTALIFPFRILYDIISSSFKLIAPLGKIVLAVFSPLISAVDAFGQWLTSLRKSTDELDPFASLINKVADAITTLLNYVAEITKYVSDIVKNKLIEKLSGPFKSLLQTIKQFKTNRINGLDIFINSIKNADITETGNRVINFLKNLYNGFVVIGNIIARPVKYFNEFFKFITARSGDLSTFQKSLTALRWTFVRVFDDIENKLKEIGIDIGPVRKAITGFMSTIRTHVENIWNKIAPIIDDFKTRFKNLGLVDKDLNVFERAFLALQGTLSEFSETYNIFVDEFRKLKKSFQDIFSSTEGDEKGFFGSITEKFSSAQKALFDFFSSFKTETKEGTNVFQNLINDLGITFPKVLKGTGAALIGGGIYKFIKTLKETKEKKGGNIFNFDNLVESLNPFSDAIEKVKTATSSFNIVSFAIGIGLLAASLIALSYVPSDRLAVSLGTIGTSLAGFIGTIAAVNKVMGDKGTFRLVGMGLGMIAIAGSLLLFAKAINKFKEVDIGSNSDVIKILGGLLLATLTLGRIAKVAGKSNFRLTTGLGLMAAAGSLFLFAKSLEKFANLKTDNGQVPKVLGGLFSAVVTLGALAGVAGHFKFKLSNGLAMLALGATLLMFATTVKKLGKLEISQLIKGTIAVGILTAFVTASLWFLADASRAIGGKAGLGQFAMLIGLSVAMLTFGTVAALLGFLSVGHLAKGIVAVGFLGAIVTAMELLIGAIGKTTGLRGAASAFIMLTGIVLAITALAAVLVVMGLLDKQIKKGIDSLLRILAEVALAFLIIKTLITPNLKGAILGVVAIAGFGAALIPMVYALTKLEKLDFKTTQKNMILLGELFAAFLVLVGVSALVGSAAAVVGPVMLVGIGIIAGAFALFIAAITALVKDLERLNAIDADKVKEGLECVREEIEILTDLAHQFMNEEGLFQASLQAAKVCRKFGKGLHELAEDTFILGLANASNASESLKVVKDEIDMMTELGEQLAQSEGSFSKGIIASATAFNFGIGLRGLATDTQILGTVDAENAKEALDPLADLITMMIGLAETMGTDPTLFGKALLTTADMITFGVGLLPLVGAEFIAGLADAKNASANMTQISGLIDKLFELATKVGEDASLYFAAKGVAEAIKDFGYALLPLVASEFLSQFVDAEASTKGFKATQEIVEWLISIAGYFQGEDSINTGAGAAVDRLSGFASSLAKLTVTDFFSQFVDAEKALERLKPVQTIIDMLVGMVQDLTVNGGSVDAAKTAVESVKAFVESLNDILWTMSSASWESVDPTAITSVVDAIIAGLSKLSTIDGDIISAGAALQGIGDIFSSLSSLGTSGGIFGKQSIDVSSITEAFTAIGDSITALGKIIDNESIGAKVINTISTPLLNETGTVLNALLSMGQSMSNTIVSFEQLFYVDGNNIAVGFINGINSRRQDAYDAGFGLAEDAEKGTRDAGRIESPSKVFTELGGYIGEGFVNGIESKYGQISEAAKGMAQRAIEIVAELRARMQQILADKANELHITPVVDMADVSRLSEMMSNIQGSHNYATNYINHAEVDSGINSRSYTPELRTLVDYVSQLGEHIDNMQMVLDTGVLVGATSAKMDSQFGIMTMRRGRGN